MSFCTLCGAGFQFVGEHRPGCKALLPLQDQAPASSAPGGPAQDNTETADQALEVERLRGELTEATALLEQIWDVVDDYGPGRLHDTAADAVDAIMSLRSRAPAQHAAPTPHPMAGSEINQYDEPAAPEPSNVQDDLPTNRATAELMDRAESAEAQLAAVRSAFAELPSPEQLRTDKRLTMDAKAALADLIELLTPASSHGADPGRSGK